MKLRDRQRGISLIAALFIIVIVAFMGVMFITLIVNTSLTSVNDVQSAQALYIAQGGLEYILNNRSFPNYSMGGTTQNLGAGYFGISIGPGWTPWIIKAPSRRAVTAFPGMPKVKRGIKEPPVAELLADRLG